MTGTPPPSPTSKSSTLLRPATILPVALVLLIATILMTPESSPDDRSGDLSTFRTGMAGAKGVYETMHRLGWPVVQREHRFDEPLETNAVYLILDPPIPLYAEEAHRVLDAVRRGAGLVYVVQTGSVVADSLHLENGAGGYLADSADPGVCPDTEVPAMSMWFDNRVHLYSLASTRPWHPDTVAFLRVEEPEGQNTPVRPLKLIPLRSDTTDTVRYRVPFAAVGFPYGRGRVLAVSDPDVFRNDVIRVCPWDVGRRLVHMLEWVSGPGRPPLVFDEYHHGHQADQAPQGVFASTSEYLGTTPSGRFVTQAVVAALVLLLVFAIRPIAPRQVRVIERRSALEHVAALAQAYRQIGASRLAVRRLAHGLRRRHATDRWSGASGGTDAKFLDTIETRHPQVATDVTEVRKGEADPVTPAALVTIAEGIARIDHVMSNRNPQ